IALYAGAIGVASGSNFLSVPLLLSLIGTTGFAAWALVEPLLLIFVPIAGIGMNVGVLLLAAQDSKPSDALNQLTLSHCGSTALISLVCAAIVATNWSLEVAALTGAIVFFEGVLLLFSSFWRATNAPLKFAAFEGGRTLAITITLAICLAYSSSYISTMEDYLQLRLNAGVVAVGLAFVIVRPSLRFDKAATLKAIRFGLPIVAASMLVALLTTVDRYALSFFVGDQEIAAYVAHVKIVQVLGTTLTPFFTWFAPIAIRRIPEGETSHKFFAATFYIFMSVNLAVTGIFWILTPLLWPYIFPSVVYEPVLFFILLIGMMLFAAGNPVSLATLREGKTWLAPVATLVNVLIAAVACLVFVSLAGPAGAAFGKLLGFGSYSLILGIMTVRALKLKYPLQRISIMSLLMIGIMIYLFSVMDLAQGPPVGSARDP
ncbi:MAG: oligosaccharide flippase family protein, partial [Pseudomonadota bacterium]